MSTSLRCLEASLRNLLMHKTVTVFALVCIVTCGTDVVDGHDDKVSGLSLHMVPFSRGEGVDRKWGYRNSRDGSAIFPVYDEVRSFHWNLAAIRVRSLWGFIDEHGVLVILPKYEYATDFRDGVAAVCVGKEYLPSDHIRSQGGHNYIKPDGTYLSHSFFISIWPFCHGVGMAQTERGFVFMNTKGRQIAGPYKCARGFSSGLAAVMEEDGKWGYINDLGESVISPEFDAGLEAGEGLAPVALRKDGKMLWGYVGTNGTFVVSPRFDTVHRFSEGLAAVSGNTGIGLGCGYVNRQGQFVISGNFDRSWPYRQGYAQVKQKGEYGLMNHSGDFARLDSTNPAPSLSGRPPYFVEDGDSLHLTYESDREGEVARDTLREYMVREFGLSTINIVGEHYRFFSNANYEVLGKTRADYRCKVFVTGSARVCQVRVFAEFWIGDEWVTGTDIGVLAYIERLLSDQGASK